MAIEIKIAKGRVTLDESDLEPDSDFNSNSDGDSYFDSDCGFATEPDSASDSDVERVSQLKPKPQKRAQQFETN